MMTMMDYFLSGVVTGALLASMVVVAVWLRPKPPRRRRMDGATERSWMRAVDAAYERGRQDAVGRAVEVKPVLRIVRRDERGWLGTTRSDDGGRVA
jgi:hypothetical protein